MNSVHYNDFGRLRKRTARDSEVCYQCISEIDWGSAEEYNKTVDETIAMVLVNNESGVYRSRLLSASGVPYVSRESSNKLIFAINRNAAVTYDIARMAMSKLVKKRLYKFPCFNQKYLFMPLTGPMESNTTWLNIRYLDKIMSVSKTGATKLLFSNGFSYTVFFGCSAVKKRVIHDIQLVLAFMVPYAELSLCTCSEKVIQSLSEWEGLFIYDQRHKISQPLRVFSSAELHAELAKTYYLKTTPGKNLLLEEDEWYFFR